MKVKLVAAVFAAGVAVGVWYVSKFLFPDYRKPAGWPAEGTIQAADGKQYSWMGTMDEINTNFFGPVK